jgi:glucose/arabinose dehydrogenase
MMRSYLRRWLDRFTSPARASRLRAPKRARLRVELLERREVPTISISNATVTEGNFNPPGVTSGTPNTANFTVSLSAPLANPVSVDFATRDGTAHGLRATRLVSGLTRPIAAVFAPGDNNRLFIPEQFSGRILIYDRRAGQLLPTPFLTITGLSTGNEQGLLGLTFDPNYQTNGYFYVNTTTNSPPPGIPTGGGGATVIRRYRVSATNPNVADPSSVTTILGFAQPETNHNGGWLEFGPDGYLYIAQGDGGGANDQHGTIGNGQSLNTFLGKILRIDPSGDDFPADPLRNYRIPPSNPFVNTSGAFPEIWAYGLRNPFRNGFDRLTGDLWIGDVGQNAREEVDFQPANSGGGENYGWRTWEGTIRTPGVTTPPPTPDMLFPIIDLLHSGSDSAFALIGGYVYRGPIAELQGMYIFGDNATGRIWALRYNNTTPFTGTNFTNFIRLYDPSAAVPDLIQPDVGVINNLDSFGQDLEGNLFIVDQAGGTAGQGEVYMLTNGGDFAPLSGRVTIPAGQTQVVISVQITGDLLDEPNETFQVVLSNPSGDVLGTDTGTGTILDDDGVSTLQVVNVQTQLSGFSVDFNWPIDPSVLNLYDTETGGLGPADVTLVNPGSGPVRGSLVVDPSLMRVSFISSSGILPNGVNTATLRSALDGFRSLQTGELLDGNADGTPGGDYTTPIIVTPPSSTLVISIPDFARGPGQSVDIAGPGTAPGLPLRLSETQGVSDVRVNLRYNPLLLNITAASVAPGLPADATVSLNLSTPGLARITFHSDTLLPPGGMEFVRLTANVPAAAASFYTAKQLLDLQEPLVNGGVVNVIDDDGIMTVAYFGDTSGNGSYSAADAQRALRVAVGLDAGFSAFQLADPNLIADVTGNGVITALDATRILQFVVGIPVDQIPPLPPDPPVVNPTGPDPVLSIPTDLRARPGDTITVPVNLDLSDGVSAVNVALAYDTSRLELLDVRRGSLTADFELFAFNPDPKNGTLLAALGRAQPLSGRGGGSVLEITFQVKPDAPAGPAVINLLHGMKSLITSLNEGDFPLNPAPSDETGDALDGRIDVAAAAPPRVEGVTANDGTAPHAQLNSLTVTFSSIVRFLGDPAAAFELLGTDGFVGLNVALALDASGTRTVARLTFSGPSFQAGALGAGKYVLSLDGSQVVDGDGQALNPDGRFILAAFYRFSGNTPDELALRTGALKESADPLLQTFFDPDSNAFLAVFNVLLAEQQAQGTA